MGLLDAWTHRTVSIKPRSSYTDAGEPVLGTAVTVSAAVRPWTRMVRDDKGQEVRSEFTIYVPSTTTLAAGCAVSIDAGTTYRDAIKISTHYDLMGSVDHYEVAV